MKFIPNLFYWTDTKERRDWLLVNQHKLPDSITTSLLSDFYITEKMWGVKLVKCSGDMNWLSAQGFYQPKLQSGTNQKLWIRNEIK